MTNTLHIKNELKQLTRLYAFLDQQAGTYELGELQSMQIKLALEEAVTNVIQYAYPDKKDQDIRIDMSYENKRLTIVITDTGISLTLSKDRSRTLLSHWKNARQAASEFIWSSN